MAAQAESVLLLYKSPKHSEQRSLRQLAVSQSSYFRSLTDYQLALRDFHREKGSLLNYNQVAMSEGAWPAAAYGDAVERGRFLSPRTRPDLVEVPNPLSGGAFNPTQVGAQSPGFSPVINQQPAAPSALAPATPLSVEPQPAEAKSSSSGQ